MADNHVDRIAAIVSVQKMLEALNEVLVNIIDINTDREGVVYGSGILAVEALEKLQYLASITER